MIEFNPSEISYYYSQRVPGLRQSKTKEWRGPCPVHHGDRDSFAVDSMTGQAHCHSTCGRGWDILSLEQELTSKDFAAAKTEVFAMLGKQDESQRPKCTTRPARDKQQLGNLDRIYNYTDEAGETLYEVVRYRDPKSFRQRRPDGSGGYNQSVAGVRRVPYRLPAVLGSNFVFVVEGEKDADNLAQLGLVATCNSGGAGKFDAELAPHFTGKDIAILPDNDDVGREHAQKVAAVLYPVAKSVRIVNLPGVPPKGDVTDWLEAGGNREGLRALYLNAPTWDPSQKVDPEDKHIRTFRQEFEIAGGLDRFWDMSLRKGIPTPWDKLTKALGGGLLNGEVYAIGGNTGSGKTSLGLQFAIKALRAGYGVLMFSMEMDWRAVMHRMVSIEARVDLNEFRDLQSRGQDTADMLSALARFTAEFLDMPIVVSRRARVTPRYIVEECRRLKDKLPKLDLIVVDHLQLMSADDGKGTEYEKFTAISRAMKQSAVELNVPVLMISQTSRNASHERRLELELSDLRGSGAIEEDCAAAFLIYPDKEDANLCKSMPGRFERGPVKTWLKLDKNRYGCSGVYLPLAHLKYCTRFDLWQEANGQ
jgi:KaiC/GvpD/RAD55 family RecA-like ATPase